MSGITYSNVAHSAFIQGSWEKLVNKPKANGEPNLEQSLELWCLDLDLDLDLDLELVIRCRYISRS